MYGDPYTDTLITVCAILSGIGSVVFVAALIWMVIFD
jgi:hypothetical protein